MSAFDCLLAPLPHHSRPCHVPTTARRSRSENSESPVTPITPASLPTITNSSIVPCARFAERLRMYASASLTWT